MMNRSILINLIFGGVMALTAIALVIFTPEDAVIPLGISSGVQFLLISIIFHLMAVIEILRKKQKDTNEYIYSELDKLIEKAKKTHAESVELNKLITSLIDNDKKNQN